MAYSDEKETRRFNRRSAGVLLALISGVVALLIVAAAGPFTGHAPARSNLPAQDRGLHGAQASVPLSFAPNAGQTDARVHYQAQGAGHGFFFTDTGARLAFTHGKRGAALELGFLGTASRSAPQAEGLTSGRVNYLIGNDPGGWRTSLPTYGRLVYRNLWPGIDLIFRGTKSQLKYELFVRPGARIADARLAWRGAEGVSVDRLGNLRVQTPLGVMRDQRPVSFQQVDGRRVPVASRFVLGGDGSFRFALGSHDADLPVVVDPGLVYSTLLGGAAEDQGRGIAVDASGRAIVTGLTTSADFPTVGAFDATLGGGRDAFVTRLNAGGSALEFSTYLGGASSIDSGFAVAGDTTGNIFVTGQTASTDFPVPGGFDTSFNGTEDAFVAKLDPTGGLLAGTYLGGTGSDQGFGIAVDAAGSPILTGVTSSSAYPTTVTAFDTSWNGLNDAFATKLSTTLSALDYSTFLGGTGVDTGQALAIDATGKAIVTGVTASADFPTTAGAYDTDANGLEDVFVTKLDLTGSTLDFSTFLGASGSDQGFGVAVDGSGSPVVAGFTGSSTFPTSAGAYDQSYNGGQFDAFAAKLDPAGATLTFSTFLGGASSDQAHGIALDATGRPTLTGTTGSSGLPTTPGALDTTYNSNGDAFATRLAASGSSLVYSTFLGGSGVDNGFATAVQGATGGYVTGQTFPVGTSPFPTTQGAFDATANGSTDAFVTKLDLVGAPHALALTPANGTNEVDASHCVTATVTDFGGQPVPGVTVRFSVSQAVATHAAPSSGSSTTDANGQAQFCYTASLPGQNVIHAFADTNGNGTQETGKPFADANKTWTLPPSTADCDVSLGGSIVTAGGDPATFGGQARLKGARVQGSQQYDDAGPAQQRKVKSIEQTAISCSADRTSARIFGTARIDGSGTFVFRIDATDGGQPGISDTYGIRLSDGYFSGHQPLSGGNVQIR